MAQQELSCLSTTAEHDNGYQRVGRKLVVGLKGCYLLWDFLQYADLCYCTVSKLFKFRDSGRDTHLQMAETIMGIRGWGGKIVVVGLKGALLSLQDFLQYGTMGTFAHCVCIWTFTFHKKSGCVLLIWKSNFKPTYGSNSSTFCSEYSNLLYSFFFYYLQNLLNPVLFTYCCCYPKEFKCNLMQKLQLKYVSSLG